MVLEVLAEQRLTPGDEAAIAGVLARAFTTDFGGRSFFRQRHHVRLIWREAGVVCAHLAIQFRAVRLGDQVMTIAGLAEVATDPAHRGRGLAGRLLAAALAEASAARVPFVVLFGDAGLYAGAGFRAQPNPVRAIDMQGMRTRGLSRKRHKGLMVLPLGAQIWDGQAVLDLLGPTF